MKPYGPDNPHPLSKIKTELIWEGKYNEYGNRREVDVAGAGMPLQRIETIDEPRSRAEAQGSLFEPEKAHGDDFRNRLIWGDNKLVMASLLKEFKGKIDLIYIDPPFDVGADFSLNVPIGDGNEIAPKDQSIMEMIAYRDTWGKGTDSYLAMMYERLCLMKDLLSDTGSIFVHCDWHVGHFLRAMMDEVFSRNHFVNEIVWYYYNKYSAAKRNLPRAHDTIHFYSKSGNHILNELRIKRDKPTKQLVRENVGGVLRNARDEDGNILYRVADDRKGDDVWKIPQLQPASFEWTGFSTQKHHDLLGQIIEIASHPNSIVADFFCGSGTTLAEAERHGRRWIGADLGRFAIHTSRKRLIDVQRNLHEQGKPYRAFDVHNLGRYERQWWHKKYVEDELRKRGSKEEPDDEHRRVVLEFFRAEVMPNAPSPLIHGRKGQAFCHVSSIDTLFTRTEAKDVAMAVAATGGKEAYCLAWEFEMEVRHRTNALERETGVKMKLIQIPREVMERNRTSPPPFLEMAVMEAEPVYRPNGGKRPNVDIKLVKFMPSLAEVPTRELEALQERAIKSGFDFIDFWAIDFEWVNGHQKNPVIQIDKHGQFEMPFVHHWQDYRTRKNRKLKTVSDAEYIYDKKGKYTACVKVVDVFGCDTSITVDVQV